MAPTSSLLHPKYRPDIDGLRAVAVLSVVAFHAFPKTVRGGFVGVDVFFVISGFLISTILIGSLERGTFSLKEFYARRVRRIFPALLLVLISCFVFGWFTLFADELAQVGKHMAGGAGFVSNLLFWEESGYFDTAADVKPLLHLWSLGIEEQFYIAWPLILWGAWKARLNLVVVALLAALGSFVVCLLNLQGDQVSAFYLPQARAWELLLGAILAYALLARSPRWLALVSGAEELRNVAAVVGLLLLGFGIYATTSDKEFPGWWALPPTAGALLTILAGPRAWLNRVVLASRPLVWIGLISYPLYLWHWPLLAFARIVEGDTPSVALRGAAVALALLLASSTYLLLERPLRTSQGKYKAPILAVCMLAVGVVGYVTFRRGGLPQRAAARTDQNFSAQFVGPSWAFSDNSTCRQRYPYPQSRNYKWWFCITNKDAPPTLLLLGNSYANHLYPGLAADPATKHNAILSIGACGVEAGYGQHTRRRDSNPCTGNRAQHQRMFIDSIVKDSGTVKYAILDGLSEQVSRPYIAKVERRIAFLEQNHVKVIVFVPHVRIDRDLKACFGRPLRRTVADCDVSASQRAAIDKGFALFIRKISKRHPDVKFFDQNKLLCRRDTCSPIRKGRPLFRDAGSHYSEYASSELAKLFVAWARTNAPDLLQM